MKRSRAREARKDALTGSDFESHYHSQFCMILCLCKAVSDKTVRLAIATGATTVDAVGARCGAGTDCRSCRSAIREMIDDAQAVPVACDGCAGSGASAASCANVPRTSAASRPISAS